MTCALLILAAGIAGCTAGVIFTAALVAGRRADERAEQCRRG